MVRSSWVLTWLFVCLIRICKCLFPLTTNKDLAIVPVQGSFSQWTLQMPSPTHARSPSSQLAHAEPVLADNKTFSGVWATGLYSLGELPFNSMRKDTDGEIWPNGPNFRWPNFIIYVHPEKPHPAGIFLALDPGSFPQSPFLDQVEMESASWLLQLISNNSAQPTAHPR